MAMGGLIISVSGLRGQVGRELTPVLATEYAAAYGTYLGGGRVLVGRDSRPSGAMLAQAVMAGLASVGCHPIDIGMAATPTCGLLVKHLGAAGGVIVTASHNPPQWNGLKLFHRDGRVLNDDEGRRVLALFQAKRFRLRPWDAVGRPSRHAEPHAIHLARVLSVVDAEAIRRRVYHVVLDPNHGVGGILGSRLLSALGCRVTMLGGAPDGAFEHPPEPLPENLRKLCRTVREQGAAVGFAQDPDADRLAIVDENGRAIGEEYTITLAAAHVLAKQPGTVAVNLSTTRAVEQAARACRSTAVRSPVGEANVVQAMLDNAATLGGEGNGGVIHPQVVLVRDSFTAMALVLEAMAVEHIALSQLVRRLPQYRMVKMKVPVASERLPSALRRLKAGHRSAQADTRDGLRLEWQDRWVHVRPSNTEPVVRVIAEAANLADAQQLADQVAASLAPGPAAKAKTKPRLKTKAKAKTTAAAKQKPPTKTARRKKTAAKKKAKTTAKAKAKRRGKR